MCHGRKRGKRGGESLRFDGYYYYVILIHSHLIYLTVTISNWGAGLDFMHLEMLEFQDSQNSAKK